MGEFSVDLGELEIGKDIEKAFPLEPAVKRSKKKKTENVCGTIVLIINKIPE